MRQKFIFDLVLCKRFCLMVVLFYVAFTSLVDNNLRITRGEGDEIQPKVSEKRS